MHASDRSPGPMDWTAHHGAFPYKACPGLLPQIVKAAHVAMASPYCRMGGLPSYCCEALGHATDQYRTRLRGLRSGAAVAAPARYGLVVQKPRLPAMTSRLQLCQSLK